MCGSAPKPPPPPPPPAPPAPIPAPELDIDKEAARDKLTGGQNKGRRKLRIDMAGGAGSEGSGLNIPS